MAKRGNAAWPERLLTLLLIAALLAVVDQYVKFEIPTPTFAQHHRSELWFFGSCALLLSVVPLARVPSNSVAASAGIFSGGVLGNLISAGANGFVVPNPLVIGTRTGIAFNLADTFVLAGNLMLMASLMTVTIRYRDRLGREALERGLTRIRRRAGA
jgi:lipoprotein signal peptidase